MDAGSSLFYLTVACSIITVLLVLQTTYLYTKIRGTQTAGAYILLQVSCILWTVIRLSEAYAPTSAIRNGNTIFQYGLMLIAIPSLCYLSLNPDKKLRVRWRAALTIIVLSGMMLAVALLARRNALYYLVPILPSELLSLMIWYQIRKNISPEGKLSLKTTIKSMGDCILVLDMKQRIMDANYSFFEPVFSLGKPGTYEDFCCHLIVSGVLDKKELRLLNELPALRGEQEIDFLLSNRHVTCICKSTALSDKKANVIGTMISFQDITEYRRLVQELEEKKMELTEIQDKLQDYLLVVDRLEAAKEKREIFLKIQNSIGQEIMELLAMLEVVRLKSDQVSVQEMELAVETCRSIIGRIRSSVSEIEK